MSIVHISHEVVLGVVNTTAVLERRSAKRNRVVGARRAGARHAAAVALVEACASLGSRRAYTSIRVSKQAIDVQGNETHSYHQG